MWKNENTKLPYNREIAVSKFKSLENTLKKNQIFVRNISKLSKVT